jgi:hypothetical protein
MTSKRKYEELNIERRKENRGGRKRKRMRKVEK